MVVAVGVASLDAEMSVIDLRERGTVNSGDAVPGDLDVKPAADSAIAAGGMHDSVGWTRADAVDVRDRSRRTMVHARAAGYAGAVRKLFGRTEDEMR